MRTATARQNAVHCVASSNDCGVTGMLPAPASPPASGGVGYLENKLAHQGTATLARCSSGFGIIQEVSSEPPGSPRWPPASAQSPITQRWCGWRPANSGHKPVVAASMVWRKRGEGAVSVDTLRSDALPDRFSPPYVLALLIRWMQRYSRHGETEDRRLGK
jgi:hypothetical protein